MSRQQPPPPPYHCDPAAPPPYTPTATSAATAAAPKATAPKSAPVRTMSSTTTSSSNTLSFTLNKKVFSLDASTISPNLTLAEFIRGYTKWTGTKICCHEGGCGACTVALTFANQDTGTTSTRAVHACLRPLMACSGMSIETNDGLEGSAEHGGFNVIQDRLAKANGSQCGYCSNGFVMTMHSLLAENTSLTPLSIEREFDGNLCRCTGYRPILDAMKTFATTTETGEPIHTPCMKTGCQNRNQPYGDIEEVPKMLDEEATLSKQPNLKRPVQVIHDESKAPTSNAKLSVTSNGTIWQDCPTLNDLNYWLPWYTAASSSVMLVVGQTSIGVSKESPQVKLNIGRIPELHGITQSATGGITFGAACTIRDVLSYLRNCTAPSGEGHKIAHFLQAADHLHRIANVMVRNVGSLVGNLFLSYGSLTNPDLYFPSDAATVLFGLGGTLEMYDPLAQQSQVVGLDAFYTTAWGGKYCKSFTIPWGKKNEYFMSYKVAVRQVNSHAIVNAAMRAVVDPSTHCITEQPTILYGGLNNRAHRVTAVETALVSQNITTAATLTTAVAGLNSALAPLPGPGRDAYRKSVAISFFYKFMLLLQPSLPTDLKSATECWFHRPESSGTQSTTSNPGEYPVSQSTPKVESWMQTSGRAIYTDDLPASSVDTLHGRIVQCTVGRADIDTVDTTAAQKVPGFVRYVTAADIPAAANGWQNGEVLVSTHCVYAGQYIGVVLAETVEAATTAANLIKVTYKNHQTPIVTVAQALAAGPSNVLPPPPGAGPVSVVSGDAASAIALAKHKVTETVKIGGQFHIHMENHVSFAVPKEDKIDIQCATQGPTMVQAAVAGICGIPISKVVVATKRCGGGYGGKIANSVIGSMLAGFCAQLTRQPVRIVTDLQQTLKGLGNRGGHELTYTVAFEDDGTITAFQGNFNSTVGAAQFDAYGDVFVLANSIDNSYNYKSGFSINGTMLKTNFPATTAVRGPGWVAAVALGETIISRVAAELNIDPMVVREKSMYKKGDITSGGMKLLNWNMPIIWEQLKADSEYTKRKADCATYNKQNRWVKRGINMSPCRFGVSLAGGNFDCIINIFQDGTISCTIGGSEIGQGINTKIIQVIAMKFGLDLQWAIANITIDETSTRCISAPSNVTGGSITSGMCSLAAMHACETLNQRLAPFRKPGMAWPDLVGTASGNGVELSATGWSNAPPGLNGGIFNYNSTSAAVAEVMVSVLTGEIEILRADLLFDCGTSMNPMIDVGQVEGGFMFGIGYHTLEKVGYDATTGASEDFNTWTYKIPSAYDVPIKFNTTFLRNSPNPFGVLSAKVCGEPGVALSACIIGAIEDAVTEALRAADPTAKRFYCTELPLQVDKIQAACGVKPSQYTL